MNCVPLQEERKVPHSIELEQSVLGSILIKPDVVDLIVEILKSGHFFDPVHGRIYETFLALANANRVISQSSIAPYFENETIGPISVRQYLGKLVSSGYPPGVEDYARTVRDLSNARSGIVIGEDLIRSMYALQPDSTVANVIELALDDLFKITSQAEARRSVNAGMVAQEIIADLTTQSCPKFVPTGLRDLNKIISGYFPGDCIYVGGRPGMGKSAFAQSEALKAARAGYGVAFFSLEMTAREIIQRMLSDLVYTRGGEIPYCQIRKGELECYQRDRIAGAAKTLESLNLEIYDKRGIGITEIKAQMRQVSRKFQKQGKKLDIVFIDYLGKIRTSDRYRGNRAYELGEVSNALTILADEFQIPIVILHQLNREVENRKDKRPTMADFKSTGDIEQDAHVILFPFRPVYYLQRELDNGVEDPAVIRDQIEQCKNDMHVIIEKQRNGPGDVIRARVDMGSNAIRNII